MSMDYTPTSFVHRFPLSKTASDPTAGSTTPAREYLPTDPTACGSLQTDASFQSSDLLGRDGSTADMGALDAKARKGRTVDPTAILLNHAGSVRAERCGFAFATRGGEVGTVDPAPTDTLSAAAAAAETLSVAGACAASLTTSSEPKLAAASTSVHIVISFTPVPTTTTISGVDVAKELQMCPVGPVGHPLTPFVDSRLRRLTDSSSHCVYADAPKVGVPDAAAAAHVAMYAVDTLMSFVMDSAIYMATTVGALLLLLVLVRVTASLQRRALLFVLQPFPKVSQNCHCLSILQVFVLSLSFSVAAADYSTHSSAVAHVNSTATISTWTALTSAITASAGTTATLTLEAKFDMAGFREITLSAANTDITLVGNGAVFDGDKDQYSDRFFTVGSGGAENIKLVMSNVVLKNGYRDYYGGSGGAIYVATGGTISLMSCTLSGNYAVGGGECRWCAGEWRARRKGRGGWWRV